MKKNTIIKMLSVLLIVATVAVSVVMLTACPGYTLTLTPNAVTISDTNLSATIEVGGTATGNITLDTAELPSGITATASDSSITISGTRGASAIEGSFTIVVTRAGLQQTLAVYTNLTAVAPLGTVILTPPNLSLGDTTLTGSTTITGTATGAISYSVDTILPIAVAINQETGVVTVAATRPTTNVAPVAGTATIAITRGGATSYLAVMVELTTTWVAPTVTFSPATAILTSAGLEPTIATVSTTIEVDGTAAGDISVSYVVANLPLGVAVSYDATAGTITITGTRPTIDIAPVVGNFTIAVTRENVTQSLPVTVNLTTTWLAPTVEFDYDSVELTDANLSKVVSISGTATGAIGLSFDTADVPVGVSVGYNIANSTIEVSAVRPTGLQDLEASFYVNITRQGTTEQLVVNVNLTSTRANVHNLVVSVPGVINGVLGDITVICDITDILTIAPLGENIEVQANSTVRVMWVTSSAHTIEGAAVSGGGASMIAAPSMVTPTMTGVTIAVGTAHLNLALVFSEAIPVTVSVIGEPAGLRNFNFGVGLARYHISFWNPTAGQQGTGAWVFGTSYLETGVTGMLVWAVAPGFTVNINITGATYLYAERETIFQAAVSYGARDIRFTVGTAPIAIVFTIVANPTVTVPANVAINNFNLTQNITVGGTATGVITLDYDIAQATALGVVVSVVGGTITAVATRPGIGQPNATGILNITVNRGDASATFAINVSTTALAAADATPNTITFNATAGIANVAFQEGTEAVVGQQVRIIITLAEGFVRATNFTVMFGSQNITTNISWNGLIGTAIVIMPESDVYLTITGVDEVPTAVNIYFVAPYYPQAISRIRLVNRDSTDSLINISIGTSISVAPNARFEIDWIRVTGFSIAVDFGTATVDNPPSFDAQAGDYWAQFTIGSTATTITFNITRQPEQTITISFDGPQEGLKNFTFLQVGRYHIGGWNPTGGAQGTGSWMFGGSAFPSGTNVRVVFAPAIGFDVSWTITDASGAVSYTDIANVVVNTQQGPTPWWQIWDLPENSVIAEFTLGDSPVVIAFTITLTPIFPSSTITINNFNLTPSFAVFGSGVVSLSYNTSLPVVAGFNGTTNSIFFTATRPTAPNATAIGYFYLTITRGGTNEIVRVNVSLTSTYVADVPTYTLSYASVASIASVVFHEGATVAVGQQVRITITLADLYFRLDGFAIMLGDANITSLFTWNGRIGVAVITMTVGNAQLTFANIARIPRTVTIYIDGPATGIDEETIVAQNLGIATPEVIGEFGHEEHFSVYQGNSEIRILWWIMPGYTVTVSISGTEMSGPFAFNPPTPASQRMLYFAVGYYDIVVTFTIVPHATVIVAPIVGPQSGLAQFNLGGLGQYRLLINTTGTSFALAGPRAAPGSVLAIVWSPVQGYIVTVNIEGAVEVEDEAPGLFATTPASIGQLFVVGIAPISITFTVVPDMSVMREVRVTVTGAYSQLSSYRISTGTVSVFHADTHLGSPAFIPFGLYRWVVWTVVAGYNVAVSINGGTLHQTHSAATEAGERFRVMAAEGAVVTIILHVTPTISIPAEVNVNNTSLSIYFTIGGTATGAITLNYNSVLATSLGITISLDGNQVVITGTVPTSVADNVNDYMYITVNRGGVTATVRVNVYLVYVPAGATLYITPTIVTISDSNLSATVNVTGTATGVITLGQTSNLPAGLTAIVEDNTVIITGARGTYTIVDDVYITVMRGGVTVDLDISINLTSIFDDFRSYALAMRQAFAEFATSVNLAPVDGGLSGTTVTIGALTPNWFDSRPAYTFTVGGNLVYNPMGTITVRVFADSATALAAHPATALGQFTMRFNRYAVIGESGLTGNAAMWLGSTIIDLGLTATLSMLDQVIEIEDLFADFFFNDLGSGAFMLQWLNVSGTLSANANPVFFWQMRMVASAFGFTGGTVPAGNPAQWNDNHITIRIYNNTIQMPAPPVDVWNIVHIDNVRIQVAGVTEANLNANRHGIWFARSMVETGVAPTRVVAADAAQVNSFLVNQGLTFGRFSGNHVITTAITTGQTWNGISNAVLTVRVLGCNLWAQAFNNATLHLGPGAAYTTYMGHFTTHGNISFGGTPALVLALTRYLQGLCVETGDGVCDCVVAPPPTIADGNYGFNLFDINNESFNDFDDIWMQIAIAAIIEGFSEANAATIASVLVDFFYEILTISISGNTIVFNIDDDIYYTTFTLVFMGGTFWQIVLYDELDLVLIEFLNDWLLENIFYCTYFNEIMFLGIFGYEIYFARQ